MYRLFSISVSELRAERAFQPAKLTKKLNRRKTAPTPPLFSPPRPQKAQAQLSPSQKAEPAQRSARARARGGSAGRRCFPRSVIRRARRIKGSAPVYFSKPEASASPAEPVRRERFLIYINVRAAPSGRSPILFRAGSDWPRHLSICLIRIYCLTLQSRIRACGVIGSRVRLRI